MLIRWLLAALHLIALGIGFAAIWGRARALRLPLDRQGLSRVFTADTTWGIAAVLWIGTGAVRAFGGWEKGTSYYLHDRWFMGKMTLLLIILALEVWPMITFIRWRMHSAKGATIDTSPARKLALVSTVQAALVLLMVLAATAMARGLGVR
ncbi:MAG: DUF2214 family protein [Gemmatimonadetes bacterium]|nr:DUF2214 family protein [Gemmatimonadota bacterium]